MKKIVIIFFLFFTYKAKSQSDSILIKFLQKKIVFDSIPENKFKLNQKYYHFIRLSVDALKCYIFKNNILQEEGSLFLKKVGNNIIADREGY